MNASTLTRLTRLIPLVPRVPLTVLALLLAQAATSPTSATVATAVTASTVVGAEASDLMIRTRRTIDRPGAAVFTEVIYLKGKRQRRETLVERPSDAAMSPRPHGAVAEIHITQCDERRTVRLNDEAKLYAYVPMEDMSAYVTRARAAAAIRQGAVRETTTGATVTTVTITTDAVDTGERRQFGHYTARHVITTRKTEPGPGSSTRASLNEQDGWYLDLPDANCSDSPGQTTTMLVALPSFGEPVDRIEFKQLGTARRGYPIEEIERSRNEAGADVTFVTKTNVIDFSEAPLDAALFTVPNGYRPALPRPAGGFDLTRPDTFANRLESYRDALRDAIASWTNRLLR